MFPSVPAVEVSPLLVEMADPYVQRYLRIVFPHPYAIQHQIVTAVEWYWGRFGRGMSFQELDVLFPQYSSLDLFGQLMVLLDRQLDFDVIHGGILLPDAQ